MSQSRQHVRFAAANILSDKRILETAKVMT